MSKFTLLNGDCLEQLKTLADCSVDSLVTDPPAGISFMGKEWDGDKGGSKQWIAWMTKVMQECLRVMKPGSHGLVWAIPRTSHWTATALEDAGFEIRDVITHLFGSGFPKSLDISKAIDKQAGAERKVLGPNIRRGDKKAYPTNVSEHAVLGGGIVRQQTKGDVTKPATPEAKQWQGWGTALKPASEHWILVRKPCSEKTVAANVLKHGTGGINIDDSRIGTADSLKGGQYSGKERQEANCYGKHKNLGPELYSQPTGRFPANLVLSHNDDCVDVGTKKVKAISGTNTGSLGKNGIYSHSEGLDKTRIGKGDPDGTETVSAFECTDGCAVAELDKQSSPKGDSGASRFFYVAKASKREKNAGCEGLEAKSIERYNKMAGTPNHTPKTNTPETNHHPTVKPLKLMSYLIKMVTPPGGTCLDCFLGSGSTGVAAVQNGFEFIGIEQNTEYIQIANKRIYHAIPQFDKQYATGDDVKQMKIPGC